MSFGFGAGDIINVSTLAWKLFKSCKDAPGEFKNVAGEVVSLHVVLKETEELVAESNLSSHQTTQLQHLTDGCQSVLHDLTRLLKKYQSLGSKSQKTWDRLKWGSEGIANARTRLISNTTMLSAYNTTMVNSSVIRIERQLSQFMEEVRSGKREDSIMSTVTTALDQDEENGTWAQIGKELEDVGVSPESFAQYKDFIINWFHQNSAKDLEDSGEKISEADDASATREENMAIDQCPVLMAQDLRIPIRTKPDPMSTAIWATTTEDTTRNALEFLRAAEEGNIGVVDCLLLRGMNVNGSFQEDSMAALNIAAMYGHVDITARLLSEPDVHVNNRNLHGYTPLSLAAGYGQSGVARLLLEHPATDIDSTNNKEGQTPLSLAVERGNTLIANLLLMQGANPNSRDKEGRTPLFWAAKRGRPGEIELLLAQKSIMPNLGDRFRVTPLAQAVESGNDIVVRLLLTHPDTDPNALDCRLRTPFGRAQRHPDMLPLFKQARARQARLKLVSSKAASPVTAMQLDISRQILAK